MDTKKTKKVEATKPVEEVKPAEEVKEAKPKWNRRTFEQIKQDKINGYTERIKVLEQQIVELKSQRAQWMAKQPTKRTRSKSEKTKVKETAVNSGLSDDQLQEAIKDFKAKMK